MSSVEGIQAIRELSFPILFHFCEEKKKSFLYTYNMFRYDLPNSQHSRKWFSIRKVLRDIHLVRHLAGGSSHMVYGDLLGAAGEDNLKRYSAGR